MPRTPKAVSRRALLCAGAVGTAALVGAPLAHAADRPIVDYGTYARRARASCAALQRYFYDRETSLYLETYPREGGNPWSYVWPFSQAMIATQAVAGIPAIGRQYAAAVRDRYAALEAYWNAETADPPGYDSYLRPPLGHGGDIFYDDNEWIALGMMQRRYMGSGGASLERVDQIFALIVYGWDTNPDNPCPGGVFWTQANWSNDRNTVSNAPGAEVGLHLYLATGEQRYLDWSIRMYDWVRDCMLAPNGLYWDHIDLAGVIEKTQWSYNQGTMIGAGVLLYRATGDQTYLDHAQDTATKALAFYAENERYFNQPARFHAIFFANLLQLSAIEPDAAYREAMAWYADESFRRFRDPATGLYRFEGERPVTLLEQSGMIRIEAMLAWNPRDYAKLT